MSTFGSDEQQRIYDGLLHEDEKELPISYEEWERRAQEVLESKAWGYISGGAGSGETMRSNREAFSRWRILPRMLRDVTHRKLEITLLGTNCNAPLLLAPVGLQSIVHPDAELAPARAARHSGIPFIVSTVSSKSLEEIAEVMEDSPRWFQLYPGKDPTVNTSMLKRAEAAGYQAIVVTVDTPMLGWRAQDLRHGYDPLCLGEGMANYFTDPSFQARLGHKPGDDVSGAMKEVLGIFGNTGASWKDVEFIKRNTSLPVILKGILHPEDAKLALSIGVDGIIVSNHGGRQVDGSIAAIEALPAVVETVGNNIPVLMDSGIRHAADIVKAIALGARAVLIGRPYVYASAVAGEAGVSRVIRNLMAELDLQLALSGLASIGEINRSILQHLQFIV